MFLARVSYGQTIPNYIIFCKPDTDSTETNLYIDTIIKFNYEIQYTNLKNANIKDDVNRAIKNNDLRVIAIRTVSYVFPGLDLDHKTKPKKYLHKYGCKIIVGPSCVISSDRPSMHDVAYDYAEKYNTLLLAKQHFQK
jgi:hypothetical protein